jgi:hypothetical protein
MSSLLLIDAGLFTTSVISYESKGIFDSRQEKKQCYLKIPNSVAKWHTYSWLMETAYFVVFLEILLTIVGLEAVPKYWLYCYGQNISSNYIPFQYRNIDKSAKLQ